MDTKEYIQSNLKNWNDRVKAHIEDQGEFYDVEGFLAGKSTLKPIELEELGPVQGKSLLHLMCHFGLDTLSWVRQGARATGVDFSNKAIAFAKTLVSRSGIHAEFICSDIYALPDLLEEKFDIVFASYGILCWLPDLHRFMGVASEFLRPGGIFYLVDGHPLADIFDYNEKDRKLEVSYSYFHQGEPESCLVKHSYTNRKVEIEHAQTYQWQYTVADVVNAMTESGLQLVTLKEYPLLFFNRFPGLLVKEGDMWRFKDSSVDIPMLFSIKGVKE